jgi:hypothetical protein
MFYCPQLVLNPQSLNKKTTFLSVGYFQAQSKISLFFGFNPIINLVKIKSYNIIGQFHVGCHIDSHGKGRT